jgi:hypothetical protein
MFAKLTNLISQKTLLGVFFCAVLFLMPLTNVSAQSFEESSGGGSTEASPGSFSAIAGETNTPAPSGSVLGGSGGNSAGSFNSGAGVTSAPAPAVTSAPQANATKPSGDAQKGKEGANQDPISFVGQLLGTLILAIPAALVWVAGYLLNESLNTFVFGMGSFVNSDGFDTAISSSWVLIRDICNLAFIFGFVYVGIRTIIDPESASTKRFLSKIIIGALLINFSLFFVKFIVDFANFTAYQIYISMVGQDGSLSTIVAHHLGIISFFSAPGSTATFSNLTSGGVVWFYVLAAILLFIVAFVFFAGALLLITRFVGIVLIMVASPILFAATVFPQTEHFASDLWKKLISYAFFAPVFLLLLLISLTLISSLGIVQPGDGFSKALMNEGKPITETGAIGQMGVVLNFVVIIFFFIQSLLIAQKMGVAGGDAAVSIGNKLRGNVQSAIGRTVIGRPGDGISKGIQNLRENPNSRTARLTGGFLHATVGGVADSAKGAKFGGSMSRTDAKKDNESLDRARAKNAQVGNISKSITETVSTHATGSTATQAQKDDARMKMEQAVARASTEQLQDLLKEYKNNPAAYNELVGNMSSSQFDSIKNLKSEDLDDSQKAKLSASRATFMENKHHVVGGTTGATPGDIGKADASELDAMNFDTLVQHAGHLSAKQIDDMKSIKDIPTKKKALKDARESQLKAEFRATGGSAALFGRITKEAERAQLPKEILLHPYAGEYITRLVLNKILDRGDMTSSELDIIKTNTLNAWSTGSPEYAALNEYFTNSSTGKLF